jgi:hypothetical protein
MLQTLSDDAGKHTLKGEGQIFVSCFLLTADSKRGEHFTKWGVTLAFHLPYEICGWKSRSCVAEREPTVSTARASIPQASVHTTLQEQQLCPHRIQPVQELHLPDVPLSGSLRDSLQSVQLAQVPPRLQYTARYKNSSCIPIAFSLCKS